MSLIVSEDVWTVISNLFFIIPGVLAFQYQLYFRSLIYFIMVVASSIYHLCDSFAICVFDFHFHHHLDFFFAQFLIILSGLYIIYFADSYRWLEYWFIILGGIGLVILQYALPGKLLVQGAIVAIIFVSVIAYWIVCRWRLGFVPKYHWDFFLLGLSLTVAAITLYTIQNVWYNGYWGAHSLWHVSAAMGQWAILQIKDKRTKRYLPSARRVY